jgi:hypothetical protein
MRALRLALVALAAVLAVSFNAVRAEDWMFRRSYYSHAPQPGEPVLNPESINRSAYRRAYISTSPGFAVRGGWRYNTIFLQSGNSTDVTVQRENMFEFVP